MKLADRINSIDNIAMSDRFSCKGILSDQFCYIVQGTENIAITAGMK